ncbi:acyl carrier protein [Streptomyces sp. NBC_00454]|uniref:acyl carrier protein n=1 Tax=Streptomyces sp. NBC_00454 TaxID=2975747 RepID=UPI0030E254B4
MAITEVENARLETLREIVADILEIDTAELTDTGLFVEEYEADSLRAIEILSRIDKEFDVEVPQEELPRMDNLRHVYNVVKEYAKWA